MARPPPRLAARAEARTRRESRRRPRHRYPRRWLRQRRPRDRRSHRCPLQRPDEKRAAHCRCSSSCSPADQLFLLLLHRLPLSSAVTGFASTAVITASAATVSAVAVGRVQLALSEARASGLCWRQWAREDAARSRTSAAARHQVDRTATATVPVSPPASLATLAGWLQRGHRSRGGQKSGSQPGSRHGGSVASAAAGSRQ